MKFVVDYRGSDGSRQQKEIEASDRAAVFSELKKLGVSAITVREGTLPKKAKPTKAPAPSKPLPPSVIRGAFAGIVVVVLAVVFYLVLGNREDATRVDESKKSTLIKDVAPTVDVGGSRQQVEVAGENPRELTDDERLLQGKDTNKWIVVRNPKTGKAYLSRLLKPGIEDAQKPLYQTAALNELDEIMFSDMSDMLPGVQIDDCFMNDLQNAFVEKIIIDEDDNDDVRERKLAMIETLDDLRRELKNGGDVQQMIKEALSAHRRVAALKEQMIEERRIMRNNGDDPELIAEFEKVCNQKLQEQGASPMMTRQVLEERINTARMRKELEVK